MISKLQTPALRRILNNVSWLSINYILRIVIALPVSILVARHLGPAQYGLLSYALALVTLLQPLADMGLSGIVVRDIAQEEDVAETLGTAFGMQLIGGSLSLLLVMAGIFWLRPNEAIVQLIVFLVALKNILLIFDTIDMWFQAVVQSKYTVWAKGGAFLIVIGIKLVLLYRGAGILAFAIANLLEFALAATGLLIVYHWHGEQMRLWRFRWRRAWTLLKESWPVALTGFAIFVQGYIDQVMLGVLLGDEKVGQYSVAVRWIEILAFTPIIVAQTLAPSIAARKTQDESGYRAELLNLYRMMFLLFVGISLPIFFLARPMISLVYGDVYAEAGILFSLLAFRLFFTNFGVARTLYIINESLFTHAMVTAIVGSVVNVGLNFSLIPTYGAVGAVGATFISYTVSLFLLDSLNPRTRPNVRQMFWAVVTSHRVVLPT